MHGQAVRRKRFDALKCAAEILRRFAGQPGDDVHIDVIKPVRPRHLETRLPSARRCARGRCARRVSSFIVCGLTLMRVTPAAFMAASLRGEIASGLPASTVNSAAPGNIPATLSINAAKVSSSGDTGVPPPIYSARRFAPCRCMSSAAACISRYSASEIRGHLVCRFRWPRPRTCSTRSAWGKTERQRTHPSPFRPPAAAPAAPDTMRESSPVFSGATSNSRSSACPRLRVVQALPPAARKTTAWGGCPSARPTRAACR